MADLQLWVRVGDQDDYAGFDSLNEAVDHLHESVCFDDCFGHDVSRHSSRMLVGLDVDGFVDRNAVSFYWGDTDANLETPISDFELEGIQRTL